MSVVAERAGVPSGWKRFVPGTRSLRLVSGLVLFAYILGHFTIHATGLWSLDFMSEAGRLYSIVWRTQPLSFALYASLAIHVWTSLVPLAMRRTLQLRRDEWLQVALGIAGRKPRKRVRASASRVATRSFP